MELTVDYSALARILGVNPIGVAYGMVEESIPKLIAISLIFGSLYWYFIGLIGWMNWQRRMSRFSSALGAFFIVCCALFGILGTKEVIHENSIMRVLVTPLVVIQYVLIGSLILGSFASALFSLLAAIKGKLPADIQTLP